MPQQAPYAIALDSPASSAADVVAGERDGSLLLARPTQRHLRGLQEALAGAGIDLVGVEAAKEIGWPGRSRLTSPRSRRT